MTHHSGCGGCQHRPMPRTLFARQRGDSHVLHSKHNMAERWILTEVPFTCAYASRPGRASETGLLRTAEVTTSHASRTVCPAPDCIRFCCVFSLTALCLRVNWPCVGLASAERTRTRLERTLSVAFPRKSRHGATRLFEGVFLFCPRQ